MPSTPQPIINPLHGPVWSPTIQALRAHNQKLQALVGQAQQGNVFDRWMNCTQVSGSNLDQIVTIGAAFQQGGVEVATGIANGVAGTAVLVQASVAIGTLTVTAGSPSATLDSTTSGTFTGGGNVIGAVDSNGNNAINPGTTYTISGTAVTLSQPALESGIALYCAQAVFSIVT